MKRGRPIKVEWQQSAEVLYELYCSEADPQKQQKLQFIWLLRTGENVRRSSEIARVSERTGQRYLKWYREGGIQELLSHKQGGHAPRQSFLSASQETALVAKTKEGDVKTIWQAVEWVKDNFGVQYTYSGMATVFKRLKLSKKVPRPQHEKSDPVAQEEWKKKGWVTN